MTFHMWHFNFVWPFPNFEQISFNTTNNSFNPIIQNSFYNTKIQLLTCGSGAYASNQYSDMPWVSCRIKSPATRLFMQLFAETANKNNPKSFTSLALCGMIAQRTSELSSQRIINSVSVSLSQWSSWSHVMFWPLLSSTMYIIAM